MKKMLLLWGILTTMFIGAQAFAACPCSNPCPCQCPVVETPCCPAAPCCDPCPSKLETCMVKQPKCKCTWWKIFEDKTCCYKCNNECNTCCSAKRAHWYKFWTDRCVVKNVQCDNCKCPCD